MSTETELLYTLINSDGDQIDVKFICRYGESHDEIRVQPQGDKEMSFQVPRTLNLILEGAFNGYYRVCSRDRPT